MGKYQQLSYMMIPTAVPKHLETAVIANLERTYRLIVGTHVIARCLYMYLPNSLSEASPLLIKILAVETNNTVGL